MLNTESIHTAVTLAKYRNIIEDLDDRLNFRVNKELVSLVTQITNSNGVELSAYLRECMVLLLCEYNPDFKSYYVELNKLSEKIVISAK